MGHSKADYTERRGIGGFNSGRIEECVQRHGSFKKETKAKVRSSSQMEFARKGKVDHGFLFFSCTFFSFPQGGEDVRGNLEALGDKVGFTMDVTSAAGQDYQLLEHCNEEVPSGRWRGSREPTF